MSTKRLYNNYNMDTPPNFFDLDTFVEKITLTAEFTKEAILERSKQKVCPNLKPRFLINALEQSPPQEGVSLVEIQEEITEKILPGILNWQSPKFFGYFPSLMSDTSICADVFSLAFNTPSFNYAVSPAHIQLENLVVNWSSEALGLPEKFKIQNVGGGVINSSASNSLFLAVHAAKHRKLEQDKILFDDPRSLKLVAYVSETAHISSLRALMLKDIHYRKLATCKYDTNVQNYVVDLDALRLMIEEDVKNGLIPFFYGASIGTTWSGAIDQISEISQLCKEFGMWLNVDAAYLGTTWICPEFRDTQKGLEHADSLVLNFSKMGFIGIGGSLFYISNKYQFQQSMNVNKQFGLYKQSDTQSHGIIDYRDWKIDLSKTPTSFRFYYLYKHYGLEKIRQSFRWRNNLGKYIERLVVGSDIFELYCRRSFCLICFKLKGEFSTQLTKQLCPRISDLQQGYITSGPFKNDFVLRISISNTSTTIQQLNAWWNKVNEIAQIFLRQKELQKLGE